MAAALDGWGTVDEGSGSRVALTLPESGWEPLPLLFSCSPLRFAQERVEDLAGRRRRRELAGGDGGFETVRHLRHAFVVTERVHEALGHLRPHPLPGLLGPAAVELAGRVEGGPELLDRRPELVDAGAFERGDEYDARCPGLSLGAHEPKRASVVRRRRLGCRSELAVVLVDDDDVGELDDPPLDALKLVPGAGRDQNSEQV